MNVDEIRKQLAISLREARQAREDLRRTIREVERGS